jgi:hypothetical protein
MTRLLVAACILISAGALVVGGTAATPRFVGPFGNGADRVWLLLPRSNPRSIVVFLHGWKIAPPSADYPWVRQFWPWLTHLVDRGSAVVFPAYQLGGDVQGAARVASLRHGLETAFRRLPNCSLSVVAGYSYGASLAFYYAASARRWHLPQPAAVDAVFPAGPIPGVELLALPARVRALLQVGDRDSVAGRSGADQFLAWLARRPGGRQHLDLVRSSAGFSAVHSAPKLASPPARRAFWAPLDTLIATARATAAPSPCRRPG